MPRFFVNEESIDKKSGTAVIVGDDARHIARSLRMAVGDGLTVSDGVGTDYECTLTYIRDEECRLKIESSSLSIAESPADITLYMAYPKSDKLELVVQKGVELGALRIVPFVSERCIKRPKAEKEEKQTERLKRIAEEAAKQCGRARLPDVTAPITFRELLLHINEEELTLFCYEGDGTESLSAVLSEKKAKRIAVVVGSEGGFTKAEACAAEAAGARLVNLGPRILRCETAPVYCLSAISFTLEL
ncbi:MAG: 16S rRNA (uracil(1498)-N(3))-methyltransferase [Clostridia bacterium]|nr:16S rRNA (uracil(1498)-N(3))-methyltransferase [Clostridia bacterium]